VKSLGVGLDFDHTIALDHGLERAALLELAAQLGHPVAADDEVRTHHAEMLLAEFRGGAIPMEQMISRWVASFEPGRGPHAAGDTERWKTICYGLVPEHVTAIEGARELIAWLRAQGIATAILTNGWLPLQQLKNDACGFDLPLLVSGALGALKPDPRTFAALAAQLDRPPADIVYVGDNPPGDIAGALAFGMRAVWFDHEGVAYPDDLPPPSFTVHRLADIPALLERAAAKDSAGA
jgi:HAD superfamily hydrolase (TIGR01509 family)